MLKSNYAPSVQITTPAGVALWPCLQEPDTRFQPEGTYSTKLILSAEEAAPIISRLEELAVENEAYWKTQPGVKLKAVKPVSSLPYKPEEDESGNETGNVVFIIKLKAKVTKKDGTVIEMRPKLFSGSGELFTEPRPLRSGTEMRVSFTACGYFVPSQGVGVTLKLRAVQILKPVFGGGSIASDFGFDSEASDPLDDGEDAGSGGSPASASEY